MAYEEDGAPAQGGPRLRVQYVMVDPKFKDTPIGADLVREAALLFARKYQTQKNALPSLTVSVRPGSRTENLISNMEAVTAVKEVSDKSAALNSINLKNGSNGLKKGKDKKPKDAVRDD